MITWTKARAKRTHREFTITREWAEARWTGHCEFTGIAFVLDIKGHAFAPSIDRVDSAKGYTPENSRFVVHAFNLWKREFRDDVLLEMAKAIVARFRPVAEEPPFPPT